DLLLELRFGHHGDGDLAVDHALTRHAHRALFLADLVVVEQALEALDHHPTVHDLPVHDDLGRQLLVTEPHQAEPPAGLFQLAHLDRSGSDTHTYQIPTSAHVVASGTPHRTPRCDSNCGNARPRTSKNPLLRDGCGRAATTGNSGQPRRGQ